jgi:hypothetical protein
VGLATLLLYAAFSLGPNAQAATDTTRDSVRATPADSAKLIFLPAVVVSGRRVQPSDAGWIPRSARFLYPDDGSKLLLGDLRVSSPLPASADLRLYGLPVDQTARDYVWGHRIGGPATAVFGSRTKVNPDVVQVTLHPFLMSHRFRDTNGSVELRPTFQSSHLQALSISSDAIERRVTVWMAPASIGSTPGLQLVTSLRQSDVVPLLKSAVPELRVVPRYVDSQTHASLRTADETIEAFLLFGQEKGDWRETIDGVEGAVLDNTRQNLAIIRYERRLPRESRLSAGVSWEGDHVDSRHRYGAYDEQTRATSHIVNPRIEYSIARDACTVWVSQFGVESDTLGYAWRTGMDGGVESRATLGWLTIQPSVGFQQLRDEKTIVHGMTATVHPDQVTLIAGYSTYADYFVFHDGAFGTVFDPGAAQRPQTAAHYVASVQYEPKHPWLFDLLRISRVRKDLDVDLWGARNGVRVLSWDGIVARSGTPSWEIACLTNDARGSDGPLIGMIPLSLRVGVSGDIVRSLNVSVEGNYRSGSVAFDRTPGPRYGERFNLNASHYVNVAVTQRFSILNRPVHLTATVFNALAVAGSRAQLTVDQYGRTYYAPCWANLRLRYDLW